MLASLTLAAVPTTVLITVVVLALGGLPLGLPRWVGFVPAVILAGCYALARTRHWRAAAWFAVVLVGVVGMAEVVARQQLFPIVFVGLAITLGGMVLRKRDTQLMVVVVLVAFWTMPLWTTVSFDRPSQALATAFFVLLGLLLAASLGLRETLERLRLDELAKSEARYRGLLEVAFEGLVVLKDGRIVDLNPGFVTLCGRTRSELLGRDLWAFLTPENDEDSALDSPPAEAASGVRSGVREASGTRPNDEIFHVELVSRTLVGLRGPVQYVAVRDTTERRQAALQLSITHRAVALGTLSAGIAHEINNPLSWMMTNLQMAHDELGRGTGRGRRDPEQDALVQTLDDALQGGRRVMSIVRDLKSLSRDHERGGVADVHSALDLACRVASRQIETRARLVRDYGHVPSVQASSGRLGQVFLNLLINAARAIPEGQPDVHRITLRTRMRDGMVEVVVRDNGRGIPAAVLPHIFDPFYTTRPSDDGTGLGLSITRSIIDGLGGSIEVESREGKGATFAVRLPTAERAISRPPSAEPLARIASASSVTAVAAPLRCRVLVIDDEPLLGKSLRRALTEHDVVTTEDPSRALELCAETDFDVIVCDLMMPIVSGEDVYEHLCEHAPDLAERMIFMTGGAFTAGAQQFLRSVQNPVLIKPFSPTDLRAAVRGVIEGGAEDSSTGLDVA